MTNTTTHNAYEIHDYDAGVIRHEECHEAEIKAGHIKRGRIGSEGTMNADTRYERVEVEDIAVKTGVGWICDTCEGSIV